MSVLTADEYLSLYPLLRYSPSTVPSETQLKDREALYQHTPKCGKPLLLPLAFNTIYMGAWFIPITVTAAGWVWSKLTEGFPATPQEETDGTPRDATVRVWAGMVVSRDLTKKKNLQGYMPHVVLYDERGEMTGKSCGKRKYVKEGNFQDIVITSKDNNNVRPAYLQITAWSDDAICISAIQVTYPDGGAAIIYGDVPHKACNWSGYNSITEVINRGGGPGHRPYCFWLDADDSYSKPSPPGEPWLAKTHKPVSVNFHLKDFNGQNETISAYRSNPDLLCKSSARMQAHPWKPRTITIFQPPLNYGPSEEPLEGCDCPSTYLDPKFVLDAEVTKEGREWPQSDHVADTPYHPLKIGIKKGDEKCTYSKRSEADDESEPDDDDDDAPRDTRPLEQLFAENLVISSSSDPELFAATICADPNSLGPDYVNTFEGQYCELATHTLWPVCDAAAQVAAAADGPGPQQITDNCFDVAQMALLGARPATPPSPYHGGSVLAVALAAPILKKLKHIRYMS